MATGGVGDPRLRLPPQASASAALRAYRRNGSTATATNSSDT
jgi:hypothetical protein